GNRAGELCRRAAAGNRAVTDPAELTLTEVAGALRRRTFSSTELTRWMLERIGRWQPAINAFVRVEKDEALVAAKRADRALARGKGKGALCGVPLAHKDMYYVKGKLSECGSNVRKGWIAPATSTALTRLAAAGSFRIGALHMSEFAYSPTGHNSYLGPPVMRGIRNASRAVPHRVRPRRSRRAWCPRHSDPILAGSKGCPARFLAWRGGRPPLPASRSAPRRPPPCPRPRRAGPSWRRRR